MCLIAFVWVHLAICIREIQRHRASVTFWQPLPIACTEARQRVPNVFVQLYFLTVLVIITGLMTGRNAMDVMFNREQ